MAMEEEFNRRYAEWKAHIESDDSMALLSSDDAFIDNAHFRRIVALGDAAIPHILPRLLCEEEGHFLVHALAEITGHDFSEQEYRAAEQLFGKPLGNQAIAAMWLGWWGKQQKQEPL